VAATVVGLGALAVTAVAGSGPALASLTALVLAAAVLASAPATPSWAVRGVVTWALVATGAVGGLGWLAHRMLVTPLSATELAVSGAAWSLALLALMPLRGHTRGWVGSRAGRATAAGEDPGPGPVGSPHRAALWLAALGVAGTVAVVVSSGGLGPTQTRPTQAGPSGSASADSSSPDGRSATASPSSASAAGHPSPGTSDGDREKGRGQGPTTTGRTSSPTTEGGAGPSSEAPSATATPTPMPEEDSEAEPTKPVKTPGYAKEKPNRPSDAPSPGPKLP
jgi:hypothetical protein